MLAKTDEAGGYGSLSGFIVEADAEGLVVGKKKKKMDVASSDTRSVAFNNVKVPVENLVGGKEGTGWLQAMVAFDETPANARLSRLGQRQRRAVEEAWRYANSAAPLAAAYFPSSVNIVHAGRHEHQIEGARLWPQAACMLDKGERATLESAHAKRYAADIGMEVNDRCRPNLRWL